MNEEEVLKTINNMLLHAETQLLDYEALAIQGLLKLYNKEKVKNKRYEKYLENKDKKCEELLEFVETEKEDDYISKDKIKAEIEELKLIADNGANAVRFAMTHDDEVERIQKQKDISAMIDILQSLLDKE